ncbi:HAMP domain-containing protein [Desulfallas sp. Bu1-1]|uniref:methyl-accepting chemotaxis protein n=1 Tax=Desulfallas sp. Bu1-1 TaxID=2787620 RepID=UPI0018A06B86|nr:methyl-accepting chemotaxis protein [Desulfallas sp. Bu1-1]MBF7084586.1 HAMP domain-containing protein [Desulfallas sp. Bu1-1]
MNGRVRFGFSFKLTLMFLLIGLISATAVGFFSYRTAYKQIEENFSKNIIGTAVMASMHIDGDKHSLLKTEKDMQTKEYREIRDYCEQIKNQLNVPYAYTLVTRNDKVYFVVATENPPGKEYSWQSGMKEAFEGRPSSTEGFYTDQYGTFKTAYAPIKNSVGEVVGILAIDFNAADILALRTKVLTSIALTSFLIVLLCLVIATWLSRRISNPVMEIRRTSDLMAKGDFTHEVNVKSNDEIGQLAESLKNMTINLKNAMLQVKNQAESVAVHSQDLASSSEQVSATIEEVAGTTSEVAATSAQGAENAEEAARESEQVRLVAQEGNRAVQQTIEKIHSIASASESVSAAVHKLGEQSNRIGEIISTITNIADQTNLLALNAAIEAARAGEHGRGFAVVAEEVRKLAEQSAGAAREITGLIKEIQVGVGEAIDAMEHGAGEVREGVQIAGNAGTALEQIIQAVEKNMAIIRDIAEGARQSNEGIQQLSAANQQIASTVQQVSGAAQELANIADELQKTITRFKVN